MLSQSGSPSRSSTASFPDACVLSSASSHYPVRPRCQSLDVSPALTSLVPDALSYIYPIVALMSLDYTVFPLAPANDPEAIAHLLETKAVAQLFVSDDVELQAMAHSAADILRAKGITLELIPMIVPEDYASFKLTRERRTRQVERFANDDVVLIMHSTGGCLVATSLAFRTGYADMDVYR